MVEAHQCEAGVVDGRVAREDGTVEVDDVLDLFAGEAFSAFAQRFHHDGRQFALRKVELAALPEQGEARHRLVALVDDSQGDTVGKGDGTAWGEVEVADVGDGGSYGAVGMVHRSRMSRCLIAFSRSAGVSMPIVGQVVTAVRIRNPAWSQRNCSRLSANSNGDCGRLTSWRKVSVR